MHCVAADSERQSMPRPAHPVNAALEKAHELTLSTNGDNLKPASQMLNRGFVLPLGHP
jgi:hypothetical protein